MRKKEGQVGGAGSSQTVFLHLHHSPSLFPVACGHALSFSIYWQFQVIVGVGGLTCEIRAAGRKGSGWDERRKHNDGIYVGRPGNMKGVPGLSQVTVPSTKHGKLHG